MRKGKQCESKKEKKGENTIFQHYSFGAFSIVLRHLVYQCAVNRGVVSWSSKAWAGLSNDIDNGQLASMPFKKSRNDTYLRLIWSSNLRQQTGAQCSQWYFQINSRECTSPAPVDGNLYQSIAANIHRHGTIVGVCRATAAGTLQSASYQISMNVRNCPGYSSSDAYSGWATTSTMTVEEMCPPL